KVCALRALGHRHLTWDCRLLKAEAMMSIKALQLTRQQHGRFGLSPPLRVYCVQSTHVSDEKG
ncbi:MAG: hypothetical protein L0228_03185, partial [Planctomycetes bacterium]|nr:hypothetical protein [Planctomycetota bacterium]